MSRGKFNDLTGIVFGDLTVISRSETIKRQTMWNCICKCGNNTIVRYSHLKNGNIKSCGKCNHMKYEFKDDYVIGTTKLKRNFYIDKEDYEKLKDYNIVVDQHGYTTFTMDSETIRLHRYLMKAKKNEIVDHINRNPSDNRKSNLRICNTLENSWNRSKKNTNTSGEVGLSFNKDKSKWRVRITANGKTIHLGYFENKEDAANARREAELKYFGEFAPIN